MNSMSLAKENTPPPPTPVRMMWHSYEIIFTSLRKIINVNMNMNGLFIVLPEKFRTAHPVLNEQHRGLLQRSLKYYCLESILVNKKEYLPYLPTCFQPTMASA